MNFIKYIEQFTELFNHCIQKEKDRDIKILQGKGYIQSFGGLVDYFRVNESSQAKKYFEILSRFIDERDFHDYILNF